MNAQKISSMKSDMLKKWPKENKTEKTKQKKLSERNETPWPNKKKKKEV